MRNILAAGIAAALLSALVGRVAADEGLWPLNRLPAEKLAAEHGFEPDQQLLEHVQQSCVRIGRGGSGCFVSPNGLVLTNHHVGAEAIRNLSDTRHDYIEQGFWAPTIENELPCPGLSVQVLMEIREITDWVEGAVMPEMTPDEADIARRVAVTDIQKQTARATKLYPETVSLFGGAHLDLYLYKQYNDVRLVMAPELAVAAFGGDAANFEYPRYSLDVCFFRVYEDGRPARTKHYFAWSDSGVSGGDLVLVAGHPARTERLLTAPHLEFLRDLVIPLKLSVCNQREVSLLQFVAQGGKHRRVALGDLLAVQNARKALEAHYSVLWDEGFRREVLQADKALRRSVAAEAGLDECNGSPWTEIATAVNKAQSAYVMYYLLENQGPAFGQLFGMARDLVRTAAEGGKPEAQRLPEYRSTEIEALKKRLASPPPIDRELERLRLRDGLVALARALSGRHAAVITALRGLSPEARADQIIAGTRLDDFDVRDRLFRSARAIATSNDPMIVLARRIDSQARMARGQYEELLIGALDTAYARIAKTMWEMHGQTVYPEATGTLRLSIGTVTGYEEDGRAIPALTTLGGTFDLADRHADRPAYRLPQRWRDRRDKLDLDTPCNFACTADIAGGNSGSPVLNRQARIVGVVFDGNRQSLAWDYRYDQQQGRAVAVDTRAIVETLRKLYDADRLADELLDGRN